MPEPEGDTDFDFTGEAQTIRRSGKSRTTLPVEERQANFGPQPLLVEVDGAIGAGGGVLGLSPVTFASAWPVAYVPPGSRRVKSYKARQLVSGRPQLCNDLTGFEHAALDEPTLAIHLSRKNGKLLELHGHNRQDAALEAGPLQ